MACIFVLGITPCCNLTPCTCFYFKVMSVLFLLICCCFSFLWTVPPNIYMYDYYLLSSLFLQVRWVGSKSLIGHICVTCWWARRGHVSFHLWLRVHRLIVLLRKLWRTNCMSFSLQPLFTSDSISEHVCSSRSHVNTEAVMGIRGLTDEGFFSSFPFWLKSFFLFGSISIVRLKLFPLKRKWKWRRNKWFPSSSNVICAAFVPSPSSSPWGPSEKWGGGGECDRGQMFPRRLWWRQQRRNEGWNVGRQWFFSFFLRGRPANAGLAAAPFPNLQSHSLKSWGNTPFNFVLQAVQQRNKDLIFYF